MRFLNGILVGAAAEYFLDPELGAERREQIASRVGGPVREAIARVGRRLDALDDGEKLAIVAVLVGLGVARRGGMGILLAGGGLAGLALVARRGTQAETGARPPADFDRTLLVAAPVDQVFDHFMGLSIYPGFLSPVPEIQDLGQGRARWRIGPRAEDEFETVVTQVITNERIELRSEPGAELELFVSASFAPAGEEATSVRLRVSSTRSDGRGGLVADPDRLEQELARGIPV